MTGSAERSWASAEAAREQGRFGEAEGAYRRTLALMPGFMAAHANLALVLEAQAQTEAAIRATRRAMHLSPDHPQLLFNLGNLLYATRRPGAGAAFRRTLALGPGQAGTWLNLGNALDREGALSEAAKAAARALALVPVYAEAWLNLGNALKSQGCIEEALLCYDRALALKPGYTDAARNRLGARLYLDDDEERQGEAARDFVRRHGPRAPLPRRADPLATAPSRARRLAVGLLTSDLCDHPIGRNLAGLIEHRDASEMGLAVYDTGASDDPVSAWFRGKVDLWRNVAALSDREIAEQIRADGIDVLLVLAGRFDRNRPLVAAWRAAPVQLAMYDGGASGLGEGEDPPIAGWITDRWLHPEGERAGGDRLLRLPFYCSFLKPVPPPASRQQAPASRQQAPSHRPGAAGIVLGSFSNPAKLSPATLAAWRAILTRLPAARLLLKYRGFYGDPGVRARILAAIGAEQGDRLRFLAATEDTKAHLERYAEIDIALDPFPFSGVTTSFEALSMGVPVLTLACRAAIGRTTAAILGPLGLEELVARSPADYVERAVALAPDRHRLARLRAEIPKRLEASPLTDGKAHAAALLQMFRRLWQEYSARERRP